MLKPVTGNITSSSATLTTPNQVPLQRQFGGVPHGRQHAISNATPSTSYATTSAAWTSLSASDYSPYSRIGAVSSMTRSTSTTTTPTARTSGFASHARLNKRKYCEQGWFTCLLTTEDAPGGCV
nr:unnamed protein product [Spirometra erinaceieuropaei]